MSTGHNIEFNSTSNMEHALSYTKYRFLDSHFMMFTIESILLSKRHNLEETFLSLEVVLQGSLGVIDGGVPWLVSAKQVNRSKSGYWYSEISFL